MKEENSEGADFLRRIAKGLICKGGDLKRRIVKEQICEGGDLQRRRIVKEQICKVAADGEIVPSQCQAPSNRN